MSYNAKNKLTYVYINILWRFRVLQIESGCESTHYPHNRRQKNTFLLSILYQIKYRDNEKYKNIQ